MHDNTKRKGTITGRKLLYGLYLFFIVFVTLEIILRLYNPFHFRVKGNRIMLSVNERQEIHNSSNPKLDALIINSRNSLGFRGPEKPDSFPRYISVITVGGSATECHYLSDNKTWPWLLGEQLKSSFPRIWVNNAGLDGHSSFGHQVLLNDYLLPLHPSVILFMTGMNDMENDGFTFHDKENVKNAYNGLLHYMFNNSEALNLGLNLVRRHQAHRLNNTGGDTVDFRNIPAAPMTGAQIKDRKEKQHAYLTGYHDRLRQIIDTCRSHGIKPVFITQPDLYGVGKDAVTGVDLENIQVGPGFNGKCLREVLEMYNDVMRQLCRDEKIPLIDLASEMPANSLYYYDHSHFTNQGAEKVAGIVAIHLKDILSVK